MFLFSACLVFHISMFLLYFFNFADLKKIIWSEAPTGEVCLSALACLPGWSPQLFALEVMQFEIMNSVRLRPLNVLHSSGWGKPE